MSFDFGAEPAKAGGNIKQADEGQHESRLLGIIHLGMYEDVFNGEKKAAAPFVCALFELKSGEEGGGVNEDGTPIIVHKSFALKKGDRATLTKFMKALLTQDEMRLYQAGALEGGFGDLIGRGIMVEMKGSREKDDDGKPKYTNVGEITKMPPKLEKLCDDLENESYGHVPLDNIGERELRALPPFEVYGKLEESLNYPGSGAEESLEKIRETEPDFATKSDDGKKKVEDADKPPEKVREDLDEDQDFS